LERERHRLLREDGRDSAPRLADLSRDVRLT
jgi:hypothetical protein